MRLGFCGGGGVHHDDGDDDDDDDDDNDDDDDLSCESFIEYPFQTYNRVVELLRLLARG
jgi:hypothetical protein